MNGWWACRWASDRDEELGWRPIEFGRIVGEAPHLPGRLHVVLWDGTERYWHRATILRKWPTRDEARSYRLAIIAVEETAKRCIIGPGGRAKVRDTVICDLLTGSIRE